VEAWDDDYIDRGGRQHTDDLDGSLNECRLTQAGWFSAVGDRIEAEDGGLGLPRPQAPKAEGEYDDLRISASTERPGKWLISRG
jgi:hypothetical protein